MKDGRLAAAFVRGSNRMKNQTHSLRLVLLLLVCAGALVPAAPVFGQAGRYALVIGNGNYAELGKLKNPVNDAHDIADALTSLGFQVERLADADLASMEDAVVRLGSRLSTSKDCIGFFFYAGHGVQSNGINYLIPADARIASESFLRTKALAAQEVLDTLQQAGNSLNVVVLDACRNNPFSWARSGTRGLTVVAAQPTGSIIAYATSAGSVAQDGTGRNGVFTTELLKNLQTPGIEIKDVFNRTGAGVQAASGGTQVPAVYNQFFGNAYLAGPGSSPEPARKPSFTIEKAYGSVAVTVKAPGTLYLNSAAMGQLAAGSSARLDDIEAGPASLEMRYADGRREVMAATVPAGGTVDVTFTDPVSASVTRPLTVAFMPGVADPFYSSMEKGIRAKAKELGMNVVVGEYPTAWGPENQRPRLEALMEQVGIDLLLIAPASTTAMVDPLKKIADRGIPVITLDTFLGDGDYARQSAYSFPLTCVGTDNELGGKLIAEHLAKLIGERGKVYVCSTTPDASSATERGKGFREGIAEFPHISLVGMDYCMFDQQRAAELTAAALRKNPDIAGIFCTDIFGAKGSAQAVRNAGRVGAVKIAAWDASATMIDALRAGSIDLVLAQLPGQIGALGVQAGEAYLSAKTMPRKKIIPGFQFFTRDNVDDPDMQQYLY